MKTDTQDATTHIPGWPKTPLQMLERIEKRWQELEDRDISNCDFSCLMSDVSDFIHEHKGIQDDMLSALKAAKAIKEGAALKSTSFKLEALIEIGKLLDAAIAKAGGQ